MFCRGTGGFVSGLYRPSTFLQVPECTGVAILLVVTQAQELDRGVLPRVVLLFVLGVVALPPVVTPPEAVDPLHTVFWNGICTTIGWGARIFFVHLLSELENNRLYTSPSLFFSVLTRWISDIFSFS